MLIYSYFCRYTLSLYNCIMGCHENYAILHKRNGLIIEEHNAAFKWPH